MNPPFNVEGARESLLKISKENTPGMGLANVAQVSRTLWSEVPTVAEIK